MEQKILRGRKKALTIIVSLTVLSLISSLLIFYLNNWSFHSAGNRVMRLMIEIGLFFALFDGKSWARSILNVLFILGILLSIISIMAFFGKTHLLIISIVTVLIYSYAVYIFNTDDDFDAFFMSQKLK